MIYNIYKLTFKNGKSYIGMTSNFNKRLKTHIKDSKLLKYPIYYAMNKYIFFSVEIIASCKTIEDAFFIEKFCIKQYSSYIKENGYNSTYGGDGTVGFIRDEEFKNKVKEGLKKSLKNQNRKKVGYKKGNKPWSTGLKGMGILKANKGSFKKGESRLLDYAKKRKGLVPWNKNKKTPEDIRLKLAISHGAKSFNVISISENKIIATYINQGQCAREMNLSSKNISACLNGSKKTHKGFRFEFIKEIN